MSKELKGYVTLTDRDGVIYFYQSKNQVAIAEVTCKRTFSMSLHMKYSFLGSSNLKTFIGWFKTTFKMNVFYRETMSPDDFRPEICSLQVHTNIICNHDSRNILQTLQHGVSHQALIIIFPCQNDDGQEWDSCIVYHPLQHESSALSVLEETIERAPPQGQYTQHGIKGKQVEDCEFGFYMILYSLIGSRTKTLNQFKRAINSIEKEPILSQKVRRWISSFAASYPHLTDFELPAWIRQILLRSKSNTILVDSLEVTTAL